MSPTSHHTNFTSIFSLSTFLFSFFFLLSLFSSFFFFFFFNDTATTEIYTLPLHDALPISPPRRVGDPLSIRRELVASLRRLDVERIDLYQMHWPAEDGTPLEDYWGTLLQLKEEGKVHAVGLSNHDARQLEAAERLGHVDTLQPPFSAIRREVAAAELPWCAAHRTGGIVYSPMQSGLLTGAFSVARAAQLGADDWRSRSPDFTGHGLRRNLALADALRPIAERHGATVAAVAVAWTLAWPGVSGAIVGARSPAQVDGWIGSAALALTDAGFDENARALQRTRAGTGPVRPGRPFAWSSFLVSAFP